MIKIDPIQRASKAEALFRSGYNCSQSVILAFEDLFDGITIEKLSQISLGFGGGMGRMRQVCGAFSASVMISGLISPVVNTNYSLVQFFAEEFKKANGPSIICGDLLGHNASNTPLPTLRTSEYYQKRPCPKIVYNTALYVAEYLSKDLSKLPD